MNLVVNAIAFYVTANLISGMVISGAGTLLVVAVVWGLLSTLLKPVLVFLTLPVNIMTLGLFTLVINAVMIMIMSNWVSGFRVDGFSTAILAAIVLAVVNMFLSGLK